MTCPSLLLRTFLLKNQGHLTIMSCDKDVLLSVIYICVCICIYICDKEANHVGEIKYRTLLILTAAGAESDSNAVAKARVGS